MIVPLLPDRRWVKKALLAQAIFSQHLLGPIPQWPTQPTVDLRAKSITGKAAEAALGQAHITVNKNAIPNDPEKAMVTSGIRLGTPACTTRGFGPEEMTLVGNLIADVLEAPEDASAIARVRAQVEALTARFPVYR